MLYKFIDEHLVKKFEGDFVVVNNMIYTSPTEEILKIAGYKPLVETEAPEIEENQYLQSYYEDCEDTIELRYEVKTVEEIPEEEVPSEE